MLLTILPLKPILIEEALGIGPDHYKHSGCYERYNGREDNQPTP